MREAVKEILLVLAVIAAVAGVIYAAVVADGRATARQRERERPFIEKCTANGGLVVRSQWGDGRIVNCLKP